MATTCPAEVLNVWLERSRSLTRTSCFFRRRITRSSISRAITLRSPTARYAARAAARTCSCATRMVEGEHFYQKRAPQGRPSWVEVAKLRFPSGRTAEEVVPRDAAALAWLANLACLELHPIRCERKISSIPMSCESILIRYRSEVEAGPAGDERGARGSAGLQSDRLAQDLRFPWHAYLRAYRKALGLRRSARRHALALAREVERRAPKLATSRRAEGRASRRVR